MNLYISPNILNIVEEENKIFAQQVCFKLKREFA